MHYPIAQRRLDNGVRVLSSHDPAAPGVAINLWYRVGSADEAPGSSGFAHLFEHLMFAGSAQVEPSEHIALMQSVGGQANATTSFDRTNYFETVPVHAAELALWLESERLSSLRIDQTSLDTQREVVKEEKRQRYDNVPYGDQLELLLALNFPDGHPYATPTIGSMDDLNAASLDQVGAFHATWYRPETLSLVVCGPLPDDEVFRLADRYLGHIAAPAVPSGRSVRPDPLPPHIGLPRTTVVRHVPTPAVHLCWRTPQLGDDSEEALGQALDVLASGQSSRLHRRLVRETEAAEAVGASQFGLARGTSLSMLVARPRQGHALDELEAAVVDEVERLADQGPTQAELDRVQAGTEREWFAELATVDTRADDLNECATLLDDPDLVNRRLRRMRAVTPEAVARAAAVWLAPDARAVLDYVAEDAR